MKETIRCDVCGSDVFTTLPERRRQADRQEERAQARLERVSVEMRLEQALKERAHYKFLFDGAHKKAVVGEALKESERRRDLAEAERTEAISKLAAADNEIVSLRLEIDGLRIKMARELRAHLAIAEINRLANPQ